MRTLQTVQVSLDLRWPSGLTDLHFAQVGARVKEADKDCSNELQPAVTGASPCRLCCCRRSQTSICATRRPILHDDQFVRSARAGCLAELEHGNCSERGMSAEDFPVEQVSVRFQEKVRILPCQYTEHSDFILGLTGGVKDGIDWRRERSSNCPLWNSSVMPDNLSVEHLPER